MSNANSRIGVSATTVALRGRCSTKRHLADHHSGAYRGDVLAAGVHAGLTLENDVALLPHPPLVDEHRARLGLDVVGQFRDTLQLVVAEAVEERDPAELLGAVHRLFPVPEHGPDSTTFARTMRKENPRCEQR